MQLIPPAYVKAFVKRQKNDAADAEAICEAASRPTMNFVAVKTVEQQARGMLFRTRDLLVRQRTQTINALRGHLAEFGVVAPQGPVHVKRLASALDDPNLDLPEAVRELAGLLLEQIAGLGGKIDGLGEEIRAAARQDDEVRRLMTVPGIGPITADGGSGLRAADGDLSARPGLRRLARTGAASATRPAASRGWAGYRRWASAI